MIGLLRFVGVLNAAVWLGAAIFFTMGAGPALVSPDMLTVLGAKNFPYFSGAVAQIVLARFLRLQVVCAVIAVVHLVAEWLYLGRPAQKLWLGLLLGLLVLSVAGNAWLCPKLSRLHLIQYALNTTPQDIAAAAKSFRAWQGVFQVINVLMIGALGVYFWRVTNPADSLRFVRPVKFRG